VRDMTPGDVEIGDIVMVHGIKTGKVVHKFLSETGAALEDHIVINYGPIANGLKYGI
jgi:hypothetical protein